MARSELRRPVRTPFADTSRLELIRLLLPSVSIAGSTPSTAAKLVTRLIAYLQELEPIKRKGEFVVECQRLDALDADHLSRDAEQRLRTTVRNLIDSGESSSVLLDGVELSLRLVEKPARPRSQAQHSSSHPLESMTEPIVELFKSQVASKLKDLPSEFGARRTALRGLHDATRQAIATEFEAALNEKAKSLPHETYEDKKTVAKWVNAELRELGLAIRCPRTGLPAILIGHSGGVPGVGRFQFEVVEPGGLPRRTLSSAVLPPLQLRPDDLARGQHVARPDRSR